MLVDPETALRMDAFTKYARFLSGHFGVAIELDGVVAATDGATITLPALGALTPRELEFLYAVLLHEVGHIRYSDFSAPYFARMPSAAFAAMHNAVEDARVEMQLMKDFDGARRILTELYADFAVDRQLMGKVFGIRDRKVDRWTALGIAVHARLLPIAEHAPLAAVVGASRARDVDAWATAHDLDAILAAHSLQTAEDAFVLTRALYDVYFHSTTDTSAPLPFLEQDTALDDALIALRDTIPEAVAETREALAVTQEALAAARRDVADLQREQQANRSAAARVVRRLESTNESVVDLLEARAARATTAAILEAQAAALAALRAKASDLAASHAEAATKLCAMVETARARTADKRAALAAKLASATRDDRRANVVNQQAALDAQSASTEARIETRRQANQSAYETRRTKLTEQTVHASERLAGTRRDVAEAATQLAHAERRAGATLSALADDALDAAHTDARAELDVIAQQTAAMDAAVTAKQQSVTKSEEQLQQLRSTLDTTVMTSLMALEAACAGAGLPGAVLPAFTPDPAWPEANAVQQSFDEQATEQTQSWVVNGAGLGTGSRNLLVYVDRAAEHLEALDLGALFAGQVRTSKLEAFNDGLGEMRAVSAPTGHATYAGAAHYLPVTTQFDTVRTIGGVGDASIVSAIRTEHRDVLRQLKAVARTRLRFGRKDRFKGNHDEGSLDARSAWKLAAKTDESYFEVNRPVPVNKLAASIAVDISGSQDKAATGHGARLRDVALLLSDALSEVHVNHEILGFHAPVCPDIRAMRASRRYARHANRLETVVYRRFTDRTSVALSELAVQCTDNADGESLRVAAGRLKRAPARQRVLFVVTDGKPYLSDGNVGLLDDDLRATLEECRRDKIDVFAFGFVDGPEAFYGDRYCRITTYEDLVRFLDTRVG